jgi:hypothetical protein
MYGIFRACKYASRTVTDYFLFSPFLEVLHDLRSANVDRVRLHLVLLNPTRHGPKPTKWDRPTHAGSFFLGLGLQGVSSNYAEANVSFVRLLKKVSVEKGCSSSDIEHGSIATACIDSSDGRILSN